MTTTIVTAFFNFSKKKFDTNAYHYWINNYLPYVNNPMVIFTDKESYELIKQIRSPYEMKTDIIIIDIKDFYTYKYLDHWKKDIERDHEKNYHSIELYMIWNEKTNFLKLAIDKNKFNSDYFIWTDIGMIREEYYKPLLNNFPNNKKIESLDKSKIYLLNFIPNIDKENLKYVINIDFDNIYPTEKYRFKSCIGGGVIFGHKNAINEWFKEYYEMLELFVKADYFAGKDQSIMANVCVKNPNLVKLIQPEESPYNNDWFYMLHYFSFFEPI